MRIAIANDNDVNRATLKHIIETLPNNEVIWTAVDGSDAIKKCQNDTPDLILMDMIMPIKNGCSVGENRHPLSVPGNAQPP